MGAEEFLGVVKGFHPRMRDSGFYRSGFSLRGEGSGGGVEGGVCVELDKSLEPALDGREESGTVPSQPPP